MFFKNRAFNRILFTFLISVLGVGGYFLWVKVLYPIFSHQKEYDKAFALYEKHDLAGAKQVIHGLEEKIILLENGCSLVISIDAELEDFAHLERFSTLCLEKGLGIGIAHEGYAFSLSKMGRTQEAIAKLESEQARYPQDERIQVALAHLYLFEKKLPEAQELFLTVVRNSSIWSAWAMRILRLQSLTADAMFLEKLVEAVCQKKEPNPVVEKKLLELAEKFNLKNKKQLEEHLSSKSPS